MDISREGNKIVIVLGNEEKAEQFKQLVENLLNNKHILRMTSKMGKKL